MQPKAGASISRVSQRDVADCRDERSRLIGDSVDARLTPSRGGFAGTATRKNEAELEEPYRDKEKGSQEDIGEFVVMDRVAKRRHECWRELTQS